MVRAPRKRVVIGVVVLVAAVSAAFARHPIADAICFPFLSTAERKVIGKWQAEMIGGTNVTTVRADHTWSSVGGSCLGDDDRPIVGRWKVDGSDLVLSFESRQFGDYPAPDPKRLSIQRMIEGDRRARVSASQNPEK